MAYPQRARTWQPGLAVLAAAGLSHRSSLALPGVAGLARRPALALLAAAALGALACAHVPETDPAGYRAQLTGTWLLDPALSNDSAALALAFADSADPRLHPRRAWRTGRSGWDAADSVVRASDPVRAARLALAAVREPPPRLVIAATDSLVTFRYGEGQDVALRTGWAPATASWPDGRAWQVRARWREGRLEVERQQSRGEDVELREYYSRSPGGDRLVVWTVISVREEELSVRRVYRLAAGGEEAASKKQV